MFWQAFIAQAHCQWKETLFQCSVQCGIVHHIQLWHIGRMMLWLHLAVPLGWCRACWSSWTNWRNRLRAPRSKGMCNTLKSIKEKQYRPQLFHGCCILTWIGWPWQFWPSWAIWAKRWRISRTSGGYISTGTQNTTNSYTSITHVKTVCLLQGPPGLPGLPGEPGPEGIGYPGPKVDHSKFYYEYSREKYVMLVYNSA